MISKKNIRKNLKIKIAKYPSEKGIYEFHISRKCREKYDFNDDLFSLNGDVIFANFQNARKFTNKFIKKQKPEYLKKNKIRGSEITAIGLMDEIYHYIINLYKEEIDSKIISKAYKNIGKKINSSEINNTFKLFLTDFPNNSIYNKKATINEYLKKQTQGISNSEIVLEEIILLWLSNINPGYKPYKELFDDNKLKKDSEYQEIINELKNFLKNNPKFKKSNNYLIETLNSPMLYSPNSIKGQLEFILNHWGKFLDKFLYRILSTLDYLSEEDKSGFINFHSVDVLGFKDLENEPEKFSPDKEWMPNVVLIAKSIYVWLDQLSKKYSQNIYRLDQIPDEELNQLQNWGFNSLWLIGIWERSQASKKIKRKCGNPEAEASAYSLFDYNISLDIGGYEAFMNLKTRAESRGLKLASDMVPNHTGIDSKWIYENPDWFLSLPDSPFPSYSFNGENLSGNSDVGIYLEDKYYDRTDAAVVFKYKNFSNSSTKFIYHGNDGTGMPWNDTAQLDYLNPEVREAVIQKILHVAGMFPVIRFDAAMTLTKKHYQRLWFPEPGTGGDIPSRAEHGISKKQFNKYIPKEFWREVVDRIAKERPDTLLLAEAFWFMEGYFVRTLGMHRVYNSAFMNMLKSEENKNYRYTIKNVLEFNPEILKRFVNFMNNPDEETAVAQFGKQDKYFGVCIMMCTMPGLPMFGHGQIEGFNEKYGMEFRKSYWNEGIDHELVYRHEREVFPLLKKRYIFSESKNFLLYDFYTKEGHTNENVFAYSNSYGDEKALVVYNNKFDNTDGWVKTSVGFLDINNSNKVIQRSLGEGLDLHNNLSYYCIFKDFISGLFYIRNSKDIYENGLFVELGAFKYHVFMDIYEVQDNIWHHFSHLNAHLNGRGAYNIQQTLKEIIYKPVHNAFEELINPEMLKFIFTKRKLNKSQKIDKNMLSQVEKKIFKLLTEINNYLDMSTDQDELVSEIMQSISNFIRLPYVGDIFSVFDLNDQKEITVFFQNDLIINDLLNWIILLICLFVCKLGKLVNKNKYQEHSIKFIDDWLLDKIIRNTLREFNIEDFIISRFLNLIKITIFYQNTFINNLSNKKGFDTLFQKLITDSNIRLFINVNLYNEAVWFNKENFELLFNFIFVHNFIELINTDKEIDKKNKNAVITMFKTIKKWKKSAEKSNYQLDKMLKIISD